MSLPRHWLSLWVCLLSPLSVAADELPPRAIARLGGYQFYHGGYKITCAAISPDGRRIATAGRTTYNRIFLWDGATGEWLRELKAEDGNIYDLTFSPDGKRLAAGCRYLDADKHNGVCVVLFEVASGKKLLRVTGFENDLRRVRFSANSKQLHVNECEGPVTAWDAATGKKLFECKPPEPPPVRWQGGQVVETVREGLLSPAGKTVAWRMHCIGLDKDGKLPQFEFGGVGLLDTPIVRVHDVATGKLLFRQERPTESFEWFCFSADGQQLSAICFGYQTVEKSLLTWEVPSGKEVRDQKKVRDVAKQFALSPDTSAAAILRNDWRVRLWNLKTADQPRDLCPVGLPPLWPHQGLPLDFTADGKRLLVPCQATLRLWDATTGKEVLPAPGHRQPVDGLAFSADGKTLVSRGADAVCRWDVNSGKEIERFILGQERANDDRILSHSPDGRLFLDGAEGRMVRFRGRAIYDWKRDGQVRIRETATGRVVRELAEKRQANNARALFSPSGDKVIVMDKDVADDCCVYEVATGKLLDSFRAATQQPVFSPDGRQLAYVDKDYVIHLRDVATGRKLRSLSSDLDVRPKPREPGRIVFSSDGGYLASGPGYVDRKRDAVPIRIFDVRAGREIARFFVNPENEDKYSQYTPLAISPDNRLLAAGVREKSTIHLIEIASGGTRAILKGHRADVRSLAFSPDGQTLASGGDDNVIYLWDATGVRTRKPVDNPDDKQLAAWWSDLSGHDTARAAEALTSLIQTPERGVAFLAERLRPVAALDDKRVARLIADLDADTFPTREAASAELAHVADRVEEALRQALKKKPPPEAKRRIEELVAQLDRHVLSPETLRNLRAVEALEYSGTPEARKLLEALAKGAPEARQTREAKAALKRLEK